MTDYRVIIPDELYTIVRFKHESMPGVAVINESLCDFEPKIVFAWHLSLVLRCDDLIENGMPSKRELAVIEPFGDHLDGVFKGYDSRKPNALFLARITWRSTPEPIYRLYEPSLADAALKEIIEKKSHPRGFDYRIDNDPDWKLAEWHLKVVKRKKAQPGATDNPDDAQRVRED